MLGRVVVALALLLGIVAAQQADAARVVLFFRQSSFIVDSLSATIINAYSTRKVRSGYGGNPINAALQPGGATQDIGFTAGGDLNTATLATFIGGNNGGVKVWYDQIAAANATNAAVFQSPGIVNTGVNITQGGHVCPQFYAASGITGFNSSTISFQGASPVSQPLFFSITFGFTNTASDFVFDGGSGSRLAFGISTTNYAIFAGTTFRVGGTVDTSMHNAIVVFNDPGNPAVYIDGGANVLSGGTAGANQLYGGPGSESLGPGSLTQAYLCEVIIGLGSPSAGDISKLRTSSHSYWGTP